MCLDFTQGLKGINLEDIEARTMTPFINKLCNDDKLLGQVIAVSFPIRYGFFLQVVQSR